MSLVAAMEFVGTIGVALYGMRTGRNLLARLLAAAGVFILIDVRWSTDPIGLFWSTLNAVLFAGHIVLGHRAASGGVERLGAAMSRLPRATFALMLALLPATATLIAAIVLAQMPTVKDIAGVALVMAGAAVHRPATAP